MEEIQQDASPSNTIPTPPVAIAPETTPENKSAFLGPAVGILVVMLVLILGGLYLLGSTLTPETQVLENTAPENIVKKEETPGGQKVTPNTPATASDDLNDIEKDLADDASDPGNYSAEIDAAFEGGT